MRIIEPSISEREAEQQYPTRYWDGHPGVKEFFNCTTDDLQDAYMRGRETDTIDYPVVDLGVIKAADLVDIICRAYHNGLAE